jgi:hypothetical protein
MKKFKLQIDNPCSQKWENFTPVGENGFCAACQKEVIDFTKLSDTEIREYFQNRPKNVCGQFRNDQLRVYSDPKANKNLSRWLAWPIAATATLFSVNEVTGQERDRIEITQNQKRDFKNYNSTRLVEGKVTDESGEGLPGVNVVIRGTTTGVTTDLDGKYKIEVPVQKETILVFSSVGMTTLEYEIGSLRALDVSMTVCHLELGEVVVTRKYSPRGIWFSIKNLFWRIF